MISKLMTLRILALIALPVFSLAGCQNFAPRSKDTSAQVTAPSNVDLGTVAPSATVSQPPNDLSGVNNAPIVSDSHENSLNHAEIYPSSRQPIPFNRGNETTHTDESGDITLNFESTNIQELAKVILGDMLKENYIIDPKVSGSVSLQTSSPISKSDLLPLLEELLQENGAALVRESGRIRIVPFVSAKTIAPPTLPNGSLASGYQTVVVPVKYIGVAELEKILQPYVNDALIIHSEPSRNFLIVTGGQSDVASVLETVRIFDVDWLKGMSVGLFPLKQADAKSVATELKSLFFPSDTNPLAGVVRLVAIERLNAIFCVTSQPDYLTQMQQWIERLDRVGDEAGQRLYVYHVQNGRAVDLAKVLGNILGKSESQEPSQTNEPPPAQVAPSLEPTQLNSPSQATSAGAYTGGKLTVPTTNQNHTEAVTAIQAGDTKVIADSVNNALVILATPQQYSLIEAALKNLDVSPLQVLIEASIVEVTLSDGLQYGLEWAFKAKHGGLTSSPQLDLGGAGIAPIPPSFSYSLIDSAKNIQVVLNALASDSKLHVLSSPSLMVLNNQTAHINVGDEVPVPTRQSTSNIDPNAPTVNEISYRNTGVLLAVTPRVNQSGLVNMDITQEVTDVARTTSSGIDAPTFQDRAVTSTVAVRSGQTIVLGGLIRENKSNSDDGIPGLHKLPLVGALFGQKTRLATRTELLVLITPRAVRNDSESRSVTDEFRRSLPELRLPVTRGTE